jgi:hypothetical protein
MRQATNGRPLRSVRAASWLMMLGGWLPACGQDAAAAAESARLALLEQEVRQLRESVAALKAPAPSPTEAAAPSTVFKLTCPQPWLLQPPMGPTLWTCRAPVATPEGMYPQCSVVMQPHVAIETKNYFEYALIATPQLLEIKNLKDQSVKINGADAFEGTFEAEAKPIPLKMMSALLPQEKTTYTVTCFAPSAKFDDYSKAFRRIIDTFALK